MEARPRHAFIASARQGEELQHQSLVCRAWGEQLLLYNQHLGLTAAGLVPAWQRCASSFPPHTEES